MNEFVNNFLLVGDTFMPEMHLKQPGFIYSPCSSFTKNNERIEKKLYRLEIQTLFAKISLIKLVFSTI